MKAKNCPCLSVKLFADIVTQSIHLRLSRRRGKMNIRYRIELSEAERSELGSLLRGGQHAARKLKRAQILLAADAGVADETIAQSLGVGGSTVYRTKRHFVEGTLEEALHEEPRPGAKRKLTGQEEALLVATACSRPPEGRARWTIELLAGEMVRLTEHDSVSRETVRRRLAENELKPWREKMAYGWTGCPAPPGCTRHRGSPRRRVRAAAWRSPAPCAARLPSPCATAGARPRPRTGSPCRCGDTRNQRARAGRARPGWARAPRQSVEEGSRRGTPLGAPGRGVLRTDRARPPCARRTRRRSSARTTSSRARA